ncbi:MAG: DUF3261 domain-containing protein, partial [Opitutaceae bacterium]|nr:DUF3261 domain-containing protein [Opitutaceae bacterium]
RPIAHLGPSAKITLPPPTLATPPAPLHCEQLLRASAAGRTYTLHAILDADGHQIKLAGLTTLGIRLFRLGYAGNLVTTEKLPGAPASLPPPSQVLADIMLTWWPIDTWTAHLPAGWTLSDDTPALRTLRDPRGAVVIEINYRLMSAGDRDVPASLRHHIYDYQIQITTLND